LAYQGVQLHHFKHIRLWFLISVVLAAAFTAVQVYEYFIASFTIADGVYGTTFFMLTGLHGLHVILGSAFLLACTLRAHQER
jgi:heme/copper-type cytochrome/quinol oxidase subunit 3